MVRCNPRSSNGNGPGLVTRVLCNDYENESLRLFLCNDRPHSMHGTKIQPKVFLTEVLGNPLGSWTSAHSGDGCPRRNACFSRILTALTEVLGWDIRANDPQMSAGCPSQNLTLWADFSFLIFAQKSRLSKGNFLTRNGIHENYALIRKLARGNRNRGNRPERFWEGNLPLRGSLTGRVFRGFSEVF